MTDVRDDTDEDVFEGEDGQGAKDLDEGVWVQLPPAGLLSIEEADELLRWRFANIVAVIGEREAGKTTLITEIYDRYLRGPFAGHSFCHSRSLVGFEQKAFQARASTGAEKPDTPRTSGRDGLKFFHLGLVSDDTGVRSDLLLSERWGEAYRELRDAPAKAKDLVELNKARSIAFILDGARVADARRSAEAFASVRNISRAITHDGALNADVQLQLVTTKFDLLAAEEAAPAVLKLSEFEGVFASTVSEKGYDARVFRTAARDPTGKVDPAWGVDKLLLSWIRPRPPAPWPTPSLPILADQFDRLALNR